jgi:hypothetical protein
MEFPAGHRPPLIVEGSEADLWLEGRKAGSSIVYGTLESRFVISSGNEVEETNPSSSRQHVRCVAIRLQFDLFTTSEILCCNFTYTD